MPQAERPIVARDGPCTAARRPPSFVSEAVRRCCPILSSTSKARPADAPALAHRLVRSHAPSLSTCRLSIIVPVAAKSTVPRAFKLHESDGAACSSIETSRLPSSPNTQSQNDTVRAEEHARTYTAKMPEPPASKRSRRPDSAQMWDDDDRGKQQHSRRGGGGGARHRSRSPRDRDHEGGGGHSRRGGRRDRSGSRERGGRRRGPLNRPVFYIGLY